jgi:RimJ/RimL family protein N-acetyltransferase
MTVATLTGYRESHRELLCGNWTPGELLDRPTARRAALAEPTVIDTAARSGERLYVIPGAGFVRYREIDWIHRRARLEIGLRDRDWKLAIAVLRQARSAALESLGLSRLYGWATPAAGVPAALLADSGFELEATVPTAGWFGGRPADRQIWATLGDRGQVLAEAVTDATAAKPPLVRLDPAGPHLAEPGQTPDEDGARLVRLSLAQAAARLRTAPGGGRGFLGLDPVTQNDASLVAGLSARRALVWSFGVVLIGAYPNSRNPRQVRVATTAADPKALRAVVQALRVYRRTTSLVTATVATEPAAEAARACGFADIGVLRRHDYRSGVYHDVYLRYLSLESPCA